MKIVRTSAMLLLLTAPLFAAIAWKIKRDSAGPVLFRQRRLGLNRHEFTVLKFRTMHMGAADGTHREYIKTTMDSGSPPSSNGLFKLERSDTSGATWTDLTANTPNFLGDQGWYDTVLIVDPSNSDIVYAAGDTLGAP